MYQMKLSRQAKHDPVRGIWCRVCETCYKSREGYIDHHGFERNHFEEFAKIRRKRVDREHMEVSRLEKRLTKLTTLLANPPPLEDTPSAGGWFGMSAAKNQRKVLEQSIITWEEDAKVPNCPFCQQEFSTYTFRRHHCRMCGRVVCSDPKTECSTEIGLNVAAGQSLIDPVKQLLTSYRLQEREKRRADANRRPHVQRLQPHIIRPQRLRARNSRATQRPTLLRKPATVRAWYPTTTPTFPEALASTTRPR